MTIYEVVQHKLGYVWQNISFFKINGVLEIRQALPSTVSLR